MNNPIRITPIYTVPKLPALIFRWQKYPVLFLRFTASDNFSSNVAIFRVYYSHRAIGVYRDVIIPAPAERLGELNFSMIETKMVIDLHCMEKFYRLAHWCIVALASRVARIYPPAMD